MEGVWPSSCMPSASQLNPGAGPAQTSSAAWGPARLLLRSSLPPRLFPATHATARSEALPHQVQTPVSPKGDFREKRAPCQGLCVAPGCQAPGAGAPIRPHTLPSSPSRSLRAVRGQLRALWL